MKKIQKEIIESLLDGVLNFDSARKRFCNNYLFHQQIISLLEEEKEIL